LKKIFKRFNYAASGIKTHFKKGGNFRIQLIIGVLSILLGALLNINANEWLFITLFIAGVLALETINSSVEELCDTVTLEHHEGIKKGKDLAAGAVLLFSIGAFVGGMIIFLPKIWALLC
jgi:diacylglycerol kinase